MRTARSVIKEPPQTFGVVTNPNALLPFDDGDSDNDDNNAGVWNGAPATVNSSQRRAMRKAAEIKKKMAAGAGAKVEAGTIAPPSNITKVKMLRGEPGPPGRDGEIRVIPCPNCGSEGESASASFRYFSADEPVGMPRFTGAANGLLPGVPPMLMPPPVPFGAPNMMADPSLFGGAVVPRQQQQQQEQKINNAMVIPRAQLSMAYMWLQMHSKEHEELRPGERIAWSLAGPARNIHLDANDHTAIIVSTHDHQKAPFEISFQVTPTDSCQFGLEVNGIEAVPASRKFAAGNGPNSCPQITGHVLIELNHNDTLSVKLITTSGNNGTSTTLDPNVGTLINMDGSVATVASIVIKQLE